MLWSGQQGGAAGMGVSRQVHAVLLRLLTLVFVSPCFAANSITLEQQDWPAAQDCELCVPNQFGKLYMRLPLAQVGRIVISGGTDGALHILPKSGQPKVSVLFITVPPERLLKDYQQSGRLQGLNIASNEQLFDALGTSPGSNEALSRLRKIEGIDTATRYTKTSKGPLHVYWIHSALPGGSQKVYFVIDGEDEVYMLAGDVTQEFFDAALTNLKIQDVP
jgi:hypothetical protein